MLDNEALDALSNFPGFVVGVAHDGAELLVCVLESEAELLEHPLRDVFFPTVGADDGVELHVQCWTGEVGVQDGVHNIVCNVCSGAGVVSAKQGSILVVVGDIVGLRAGEASEYGLERCHDHVGLVFSVRSLGVLVMLICIQVKRSRLCCAAATGGVKESIV